jgi:hypothetical protein
MRKSNLKRVAQAGDPQGRAYKFLNLSSVVKQA